MVVQSLLYRFTQWHALTKLRVHSESTLSFLKETFKIFLSNCKSSATFPVLLLTQWNYRKRRQLANEGSPSVLVERFNLSTYKFHSMGDYVQTIKLFGTMDSFTTQIVSIVFSLRDDSEVVLFARGS
jgi:hypothetical protein